MSAWVSLPTQRLKKTDVYNIWRGNPSQLNRARSDKLSKALHRFVFKPPWFIFLRRFRRWHWVDVAQVKASSFSRHFFETIPLEAKRGNIEVYIVYIHIRAWLSRSGSFGIAFVLQQFRATSTCCSCPSASLAGLMSSSFFNHSSWLQYGTRALRPKDLVWRWLRLLRRLKWANKCYCFCPDVKKIWKERKLKCLTKMPYQNGLLKCPTKVDSISLSTITKRNWHCFLRRQLSLFQSASII